VSVVESYAKRSVRDIPGTGAAGGVIVSLYPWFRPIIRSGVDMIIEMSRLLSNIHQADLLITGEGKLDVQSFYGKVVGRMLELGREKEIPVIVVCGVNGLSQVQISQEVSMEVVALYKEGRFIEDCISNAGTLISEDLTDYLKGRALLSSRKISE
jgi:glycerate kinase